MLLWDGPLAVKNTKHLAVINTLRQQSSFPFGHVCVLYPEFSADYFKLQ